MNNFTQIEIEQKLSEIVPYGYREEVARITGIYPKIVAAYFSPDNERKSPAFCFLLIQAALDEIDAEVGEAHWQAVARFREMSRPQKSEHLSIADEYTHVIESEAAEMVDYVKHASLYDQLADCDATLAAENRHRKSILEAIKSEVEVNTAKLDGRKPYISALPREVRDVVGARRNGK